MSNTGVREGNFWCAELRQQMNVRINDDFCYWKSCSGDMGILNGDCGIRASGTQNVLKE